MGTQNVDTLYAQWRWIARTAGVKEGFAYFRFKAARGRAPTEKERNHKPVVPDESLVHASKEHLSEWSWERVRRVYECACMSPEERAAFTLEQKRNRAFASKVRRELDNNRPALADL